MLTAFYDLSKNAIVEAEPLSFPVEQIPATSTHLAALYQSGKHSLPSAIWIVFDFEDTLRVFFLAETFFDSAEMISPLVFAAVEDYRIKNK